MAESVFPISEIHSDFGKLFTASANSFRYRNWLPDVARPFPIPKFIFLCRAFRYRKPICDIEESVSDLGICSAVSESFQCRDSFPVSGNSFRFQNQFSDVGSVFAMWILGIETLEWEFFRLGFEPTLPLDYVGTVRVLDSSLPR